MPVLNAKLSAQGEAPNGSTFPLPKGLALLQRGPVVQVTLAIAPPFAEALQKAGKPIPEPVSGLALIDTGATVTGVDDEAARKMQLPVINVVSLTTASHESVQKPVYPIHLQILGQDIAFAGPGVGLDLKAQGLLALIGRDLLAQCVLVYNGPADSFVLCN